MNLVKNADTRIDNWALEALKTQNLANFAYAQLIEVKKMKKVYQTNVISSGNILDSSSEIHAIARDEGAIACGNYDLRNKIKDSGSDPNKQRLGVYDLFLDSKSAEEFRRRVIRNKPGHVVFLDELDI